MAHPYECWDHDVLFSTSRQLNPDVLFAAIERSSSPPYASTNFIRSMGNLASNRTSNTPRTSEATCRFTIRFPWWISPSNPQWSRVSRRRSSMETGQPSCHERPVIVARVDGSISCREPWKTGRSGPDDVGGGGDQDGEGGADTLSDGTSSDDGREAVTAGRSEGRAPLAAPPHPASARTSATTPTRRTVERPFTDPI